MSLSKNAKNAICIGSLCSVSYLAVYFARNILSAVSPMMTSENFTKEYNGELSFLFLLFYGIGQLINGAIGDRIKAKYMISFGLFLAGITNLVFSLITHIPLAANFVYGMTGFFLAMIYGPMTKVVAENTEPLHATRCSLGYTFASFFGSPLAGVVAAALTLWQSVFTVSSIALVVMAVLCFAFFSIFERRGIVRYGQYQREKSEKQGFGSGVKVLIQHRIVKFSLISILTGVVRTTVVFWLPTYIAEYHGFSEDDAAMLFSAATLIISMSAFISVFVYEKIMKYDMDKTILLMFSLSAIFFLGCFFVKALVPNIAFLILAVISANCCATMLWSKYCPSLRDTGMVSSATGFLDFLSYMAAAISSLLFANAANTIGWGNLILIWAALMIVAVVVTLPYGKIFRKKGRNAQNA